MNSKSSISFSLLICFLALFIACKPDAKKEPTVVADPVDQIKTGLVDPCTLMDESYVSSIIDLPAGNITIKSGGNSSTVPAKSCFFKWTGGEVANAGIMVQSLGNPVPDEFPEWAFFYIDSKKSQGERTVADPDTPIKFTSITDLADQACYNMELAKCYFRKGDIVFQIALNGISDDDAKMKVFRTVANKIIAQI